MSSGRHSDTYLQCAKVLQNPVIAESLCKELAAGFVDKKPTCVIAPATGGIVVSYEVARHLNALSLFTERVDGKMTLRRGFDLSENDRVLIVEDVITTGLSTKEVIDCVKTYNSKIVGIASLVCRSEKEIDFGFPRKSLLNITIPSYKQEDCPLCKKHIPVVKPGSRI